MGYGGIGQENGRPAAHSAHVAPLSVRKSAAGYHGAAQRGKALQQKGCMAGGVRSVRRRAGKLLQKERGFCCIWDDHIRLSAQLCDGGAYFRRHGGVGPAVIRHHRVHQLQRRRSLAEGLFHQRHLCGAGKIAAVYTVKCKAQLRIVCQCGGNKSALICARRPAKPSGVGGEQSRGQRAGLHAHGGQSGQHNGQAAPSHTGEILYAQNGMLFLHAGPPFLRAAQTAACGYSLV